MDGLYANKGIRNTRPVSIISLRTQAKEFVFVCFVPRTVAFGTPLQNSF
jgi:hypothetical protein